MAKVEFPKQGSHFSPTKGDESTPTGGAYGRAFSPESKGSLPKTVSPHIATSEGSGKAIKARQKPIVLIENLDPEIIRGIQRYLSPQELQGFMALHENIYTAAMTMRRQRVLDLQKTTPSFESFGITYSGSTHDLPIGEVVPDKDIEQILEVESQLRDVVTSLLRHLPSELLQELGCEGVTYDQIIYKTDLISTLMKAAENLSLLSIFRDYTRITTRSEIEPPTIIEGTVAERAEIIRSWIEQHKHEITDLTIVSSLCMPKEFCHCINMKKLEIFCISTNFLPASFGRLTKLTDIWITGMHLHSLPHSMKQCKQVKSFGLTNSWLTEIPNWICKWEELQTLNLSGNRLSTLPDRLSNLKYLIELDVSNNNFTKPPKCAFAFNKEYKVHFGSLPWSFYNPANYVKYLLGIG